jgi:hypothetical protein
MTFPLAEASGLTFLFYLVVGAFWLIGNLMQQKQAKQKAAEMRRQREAREAEERRTGKKVAVEEAKPRKSDLEEFLKQLSGTANPQPSVPPPILRKQVVDDIQFDKAVPPPPPKPVVTPKAPPPPSVKAAKSYDIGDLDMAASFKQISQMKEAVELIGAGHDQQISQEALTNVRAMMIDLSSSSISVPIIPLQSIRAIRTETPRPDLQKRKTFKKALVASVILEAPKALRPQPFTEII